MKTLTIAMICVACCALTGCFQIEGVHVLHYYGESDSGSYRIGMQRVTYELLDSDQTYANKLRDLRSWSRPVTRMDGDMVYLEDNSGRASMEHFYDKAGCKAAPVEGYVDCRYVYRKDFGDMPDWSVDWEVVVQPGMRVLDSNNQRTRHSDGRERLIWYYDGNRERYADVDFTVWVPRAN